CAYKSVE
ncbi:hypothetical protein VCHC77A1_1616, partial [Vibrio cholerae HC-77A1]